jgi:hypothetical protein
VDALSVAEVSCRHRGYGLGAVRRLGEPVWQPWVLRGAAAFAFVWSVFRSIHQAITLDEADTYFWFVAPGAAGIWRAFPNNHTLNTLLIWIATHLFGLSAFTVRLPALLGAALYILVAYFLCRAIAGRFSLQVASFICVVYNPFILDFFAAARGYSLANAFLLAAIAVPVWHEETRCGSVAVPSALASAVAGLSFAANFSFAFVDFAALVAILIWAMRRRGGQSTLRIVTCCALPGLAISLLLCGYPVAHYPRGELWYGAGTLTETAKSLVDASYYELPGPLKGLKAVASMESWLLLGLGILCGCQLVLVSLNRESRSSAQARMALRLGGILCLTVAAHYVAFRILRLPLPLSRTGIFFLPVCTLLAAALAAPPARPAISRLLGYAITAMFLCMAAHFLLCLRYTYFKEYRWDADVQAVYRVLERLNRTYGIDEFTASGTYRSPLSFCRSVAGGSAFRELLAYPEDLPAGKSVYILHEAYYRKFIDRYRLVVVWRGESTGVAVAVPPDGPVPPVPLLP